VVTDGDRRLGADIAQEFGRRAFGLRREIGLQSVSLPMDEAFARAFAAQATPVVVADQADNVGGGAPGDSTFALRWLLEHGAEGVAIAFFYDPDVVRTARAAGVGATISVQLGGKLGAYSGEPVSIEAQVLSVRESYLHAFPQRSGEDILFRAGDVVALHCRGIDLVVSSERCQCFAPSIFSDMGIDPARKRVLIPKSSQHFYGAFAPIAADIIYMAAPGAVTPNPRTLTYRRLNTAALYPWTENPPGMST
jgi:microcystin degradation protein MlrC